MWISQGKTAARRRWRTIVLRRKILWLISKVIRFLVRQAQSVGEVMSRSGAGQIEHWAKIGKIAEENPDLTYEFIRDSLLAKAEIDNGMVDDYDYD